MVFHHLVHIKCLGYRSKMQLLPSKVWHLFKVSYFVFKIPVIFIFSSIILQYLLQHFKKYFSLLTAWGIWGPPKGPVVFLELLILHLICQAPLSSIPQSGKYDAGEKGSLFLFSFERYNDRKKILEADRKLKQLCFLARNDEGLEKTWDW